MRSLQRSLLLFGVLLACATATAAAQVTTVIVVRHAERRDDAPDSPLSEAGRVRALALDEALKDAGVSAIITTQFPRTQATAAPLATRLGITPNVITTAGGAQAHAQAIAERIRTEHAGSIVLVVGHSDTSPLIVQALGVTDAGTIDGAEHDRMYIVTLTPAVTHVVRTRYGAAARIPTPRRSGQLNR